MFKFFIRFQVRAIHDVKGIDMGNNLVRYKAELDFDGRELTRSYLDKHDLIAMLEVYFIFFIENCMIIYQLYNNVLTNTKYFRK